jgi:uncharacterized membrane protein/glutathione S-transferase
LAGAEAERRFSPFCWRTRMALAHKGLEVETVPWRFTEREKLPQPNVGRVPVIVDGDQVVHDSSAIAEYLDDRYPEKPLLGGATERGLTRFVQNWTETVVQAVIVRLVLLDINKHLRPVDQEYFRSDREARFKTTLEDVVKDRESRLAAFRASIRCAAPSSARISFPASSPPMPIISSSAPSNGLARSAISNYWRRTIRCGPGAGASSICSMASRAARRRMAIRMTAFASIALILHTVSAVAWVGGMFFALIVLRPATGPLEPPLRLQLWARVFEGFFPWVIAAIVLLLVSGYAMVFTVFGGFAGVGIHVHIMQGLGILMMLAFLHLFFAPWPKMRTAVARQDYTEAARQLGQIRAIVIINLVLGILTVAVGSSGRYWG